VTLSKVGALKSFKSFKKVVSEEGSGDVAQESSLAETKYVGTWVGELESSRSSIIPVDSSSPLASPSSQSSHSQDGRSFRVLGRSELSGCYASRRVALTASVCLTECLLKIGSCQAEESFAKFAQTVGVEPDSESKAKNTGQKVFTPPKGGQMYSVVHSESGYPELIYLPPKAITGSADGKKLPLLIVLHGAGQNEEDVWNLANRSGEHAGLAPSLLASGQAPSKLSENFLVAAPYSYKKQTFYDDSRSDLLRFIKWLQESSESGVSHLVDPERVFLFGFSDGATVGVELMLTRRFRGGVFAAYGFTGQFPSKALEFLKDLNLWVFHSKDDVIFPVKCSDNLVASLRKVNSRPDRVRYTRYEKDQEGFTGAVKGHSTGITASKLPDIYEWMLGL
jgi:predicted esterase